MIDKSKLKFKPRAGLGEMAFRKYEKIIADACKGSFEIDPITCNPPLKASSFAVGLRDALKGFKTYDYASTMIPPAYEVNRIKVRELEDGTVAILNDYADKMELKNDRLAKISDEVSVLIDSEGNYIKGFGSQKDICTQFIDYKYPDQLDEIMEMAGKIITREGGKYGLDWLIKVKIPTEEDKFDVKQVVENKYPDIVVEYLGHLYCRIKTYNLPQ